MSRHGRPRTSGQHIQGWVGLEDIATIANWLIEDGQRVNSMSQLVGIVFETLASTIVANGGRAIIGEEVDAVLDSIGRSQPPRSLAIHAPTQHGSTNIRQQDIEIATKLFEHGTRKEVGQLKDVALVDGEGTSEADAGEFSKDVLRTQRRNPQ